MVLGKGYLWKAHSILNTKSSSFESYMAQAVTDVNLVPYVLEESIKKYLEK